MSEVNVFSKREEFMASSIGVGCISRSKQMSISRCQVGQNVVLTVILLPEALIYRIVAVNKA